MAERLSAFERWEVPHFEGPEGDALRERSRGPMTVAQLEAAHDEAFEQGRAAGFAQGLEEGRAAVDEQMAPAARSLEEALACLSRPFEALDAEIEQNLVALACAPARALLKAIPPTSRRWLRSKKPAPILRAAEHSSLEPAPTVFRGWPMTDLKSCSESVKNSTCRWLPRLGGATR